MVFLMVEKVLLVCHKRSLGYRSVVTIAFGLFAGLMLGGCFGTPGQSMFKYLF